MTMNKTTMRPVAAAVNTRGTTPKEILFVPAYCVPLILRSGTDAYGNSVPMSTMYYTDGAYYLASTLQFDHDARTVMLGNGTVADDDLGLTLYVSA